MICASKLIPIFKTAASINIKLKIYLWWLNKYINFHLNNWFGVNGVGVMINIEINMPYKFVGFWRRVATWAKGRCARLRRWVDIYHYDLRDDAWLWNWYTLAMSIIIRIHCHMIYHIKLIFCLATQTFCYPYNTKDLDKLFADFPIADSADRCSPPFQEVCDHMVIPITFDEIYDAWWWHNNIRHPEDWVTG